MARQLVPAEVNSFIEGIITEASPINFPPNASVDEDNFILFRDGSRARRLGIDLEEDFQEIETTLAADSGAPVSTSSFVWSNAGGDATKKILAVQTANQLRMFDLDAMPISSGLLHTYTAPSTAAETKFSYSVVDGILVVVFGERDVTSFKYDGATVTSSTTKLYIRDLFGVQDKEGGNGTDLKSGQGIAIRPSAKTNAHVYNLRNQTWSPPRMHDTGEYLVDPIQRSLDQYSKYPSNADNANLILFANANDEGNRTAERLNIADLAAMSSGTFPAPLGFYIIDAMARGTSRLAEVQSYTNKESALTVSVTSLPSDTTPGGARVVEEYAGRVWYGGFSGEVSGGDSHSPRMSSYLLFSQVVASESDINKCYQSADPTSLDDSELAATDGGFLRLDGAHSIVDMVNIGQSLLVLAENGVWEIGGGSGFGFAADNYNVKKLTDKGAVAPASVVQVESTVIYWGDDAIYQASPNQFGDLEVKNISGERIQKYYDAINPLDKRACSGIYDSYDRKVRWLYGNRLGDVTGVRELVLDIQLAAFYPSTPRTLAVGYTPTLAAPVPVPPYRNTTVTEDVVQGGVLVVSEGEDVNYIRATREVATREVAYVVVTNLNPLKFTFASYRDDTFVDWKSVDGTGVDADAFILTGWTTGGDVQRYKQVPYLTFYMRASESGYRTTPEGDIEPTNESSCLLQTRWDWSNSTRSNQWGRDIQLYRKKRPYFPENVAEEYDDGYELVVSKNKLRGKGKSIALYLKTEPEKDCNILGWSFIIGINGNV